MHMEETQILRSYHKLCEGMLGVQYDGMTTVIGEFGVLLSPSNSKKAIIIQNQIESRDDV